MVNQSFPANSVSAIGTEAADAGVVGDTDDAAAPAPIVVSVPAVAAFTAPTAAPPPIAAPIIVISDNEADHDNVDIMVVQSPSRHNHTHRPVRTQGYMNDSAANLREGIRSRCMTPRPLIITNLLACTVSAPRFQYRCPSIYDGPRR